MHACVVPCYETQTSVAPASYLANEGSLLSSSFSSLLLFFPRLPFFFVQSDELCKTLANTQLPLVRKGRSVADNHKYIVDYRNENYHNSYFKLNGRVIIFIILI